MLNNLKYTMEKLKYHHLIRCKVLKEVIKVKIKKSKKVKKLNKIEIISYYSYKIQKKYMKNKMMKFKY